MMKKIIVITVTLLFVFSMGMTAQEQEQYRAAMKEYIESQPIVKNNFDIKKLLSALNIVNSQILLGYNQDSLKMLMKRYHDEQLQEDLLDCLFMPMFKKHVSLEELESLTDLMKTPEGRTYQEHRKIQKERISAEGNPLEEFIKNTIAAIRHGQPIKKVKPRKGIPKKYAKKFIELEDTAYFAAIIDSYRSIYAQLSDTKDNSYDALKEVTYQHIKNNITTLLLNVSYDILTEEDMDFMKHLQGLEAYRHVTESMKSMAGGIMQYLSKWITAYSTWLLKQPETCDFLLQKIVDSANIESVVQDMKSGMRFSALLEPNMYVMQAEVEDSLLRETQNELNDIVTNTSILDYLEKFLSTEDRELYLQIITNSKRNFVFRFTGKQTGEKFEVQMPNSELKQFTSTIEVRKKSIQGIKLRREGKYAEALPLLKEAAEAGIPKAQYHLALMYIYDDGVEKDMNEAMNWLEKVVKQCDDKKLKADALNTLAYVYLNEKQYDKALETIDQAIETLPKEPNYYDSKGEIFYHAGNKIGAKAMWKIVVRLDPDFAKKHDSDLYRMLFGRKTK